MPTPLWRCATQTRTFLLYVVPKLEELHNQWPTQVLFGGVGHPSRALLPLRDCLPAACPLLTRAVCVSAFGKRLWGPPLGRAVGMPRCMAPLCAWQAPSGCEWVPELEEAFELPSFPEFPSFSDGAEEGSSRWGLDLPAVLPLPRLLSSWEQLQSTLPPVMQRRDWQRWEAAASQLERERQWELAGELSADAPLQMPLPSSGASNVETYEVSLAAGAALGVGMGALSVSVIALLSRRRGASRGSTGRVALHTR